MNRKVFLKAALTGLVGIAGVIVSAINTDDKAKPEADAKDKND